MKPVQQFDLDAPAVAVGDEAERWSLSWKPDGRSESFNKDAILACAPTSSGVYGLFNFDSQLFIGESDNIQETLLRLEGEVDFQSAHLRPTGFTFEPCARELRELRAAELIARFHPVLQSLADLPKSAPPAALILLEEAQIHEESKTEPEGHEIFLDTKNRPKVRPGFQFGGVRRMALTALTAGAVIAYVGLAGNKPNRGNPPSKGPAPTSVSQSSSSRGIEVGSKPRNASSLDATLASTSPKAGSAPAKPVHNNASTENGKVRLAAAETSSGDDSEIRAHARPTKTSRLDGEESRSVGKKWSVQVSAAPAKDVADSLLSRLVANGHEGYVVQAEVKGQTYHRVRVGPFDTRDKAETALRSLNLKDGYRDAYLIPE
jgi:cell division septation protein DedD